MIAIVLIAGVSRRLYPITKEIPKCLIEIGDKTILDHQFDALRTCGISEVIVVLGYRREQIIDAIKARHPDMHVHYIINHLFFSTNTAYSLLLTADYFKGRDFIYLNGDVLFPSALLKHIIDSDQENPMAVEVKQCGAEEVKVIVDKSGRITDVGKDLDPNRSLGEFIGVARFDSSITDPFIEALEGYNVEGFEMAYFEDALNRITETSVLSAVDVTDMPCLEIDFPEDVEEAKLKIIEMANAVKSAGG
jgi:choline kinase